MKRVANFKLTPGHVKKALGVSAGRDERVAMAIARVGIPKARRSPHGFESLARIVVGQQVSTRAAEAITARLVETLEGRLAPTSIAASADAALRGAGLSRQKVSYLRSLADAVLTGELALDRLPEMSDGEVLERITAIRGFGVWSAHMYLMFSLGRTDIWPSGDLAVRVGFGRLMGLSTRPTARETEQLADTFQPYRSALALLCWHYYGAVPEVEAT